MGFEIADLYNWTSSGEAWIAFVTLVFLEIVLGIDNIIFISILAGKLPENEQGKARTIGLGLAMLTRIALLFSLAWIIHLEDALFTIDLDFLKVKNEQGEIIDHRGAISGRDIILILGGLFLIGKSTFEIHDKLEGGEHGAGGKAAATFTSVLIQIALLDMVFSLDSVITAVGMAEDLGVMIWAVIVAVGVMMLAAGPVSDFVDKHPTVKMLALSFLLLIGFTLVIEGLDFHIPKGYVYFAMFFSVFVELLNLRLRGVSRKVALNEPQFPGSKKKH